VYTHVSEEPAVVWVFTSKLDEINAGYTKRIAALNRRTVTVSQNREMYNAQLVVRLVEIDGGTT